MDLTRRQFLTGSGAAALGAVATGTAAAEHDEQAGANVSIEFDEPFLETYRPRLVLPTKARDKLIGQYGWVARSPDYETDVCCYWLSYTNQEGVLPFGVDSHFGDHEPLQVEVDSETGDVRRVRASIYHWIKGEVHVSAAPMYDNTHPHLRVIEPWHQYTAARPIEGGSYYEVKDLTNHFSDWLSDPDFHEAVYPGSTYVPWRMRTRPHWWRNLTVAGAEMPFSTAATYYRLRSTLPFETVGSLEASA